MPRIDTESLKTTFKKKEYRAWDNNLLETLKIPQEKLEDNPPSPSKKQEPVKNIEENQSVDLGFNKGSIEVQLESNKGSIEVLSAFNKSSIEVQSVFDKGSIEVQLESNKSSIG